MVPYPPYDDDTMTVSNGDAASTVGFVETATIIVVDGDSFTTEVEEEISFDNCIEFAVTACRDLDQELRQLVSSKGLLEMLLEKQFMLKRRETQLPGFFIKRPKWDLRRAPNLSGRRDPKRADL